jgi:hypothetical protein
MLKPNLKILIANDFGFINGGASQVAISSALELANLGHNVIFFCCVGPVSQKLLDSSVEVIFLDQHEIAKDPSRLRAIFQGIWNVKASSSIYHLLRKMDPESTIIHIVPTSYWVMINYKFVFVAYNFTF